MKEKMKDVVEEITHAQKTEFADAKIQVLMLLLGR